MKGQPALPPPSSTFIPGEGGVTEAPRASERPVLIPRL